MGYKYLVLAREIKGRGMRDMRGNERNKGDRETDGSDTDLWGVGFGGGGGQGWRMKRRGRCRRSRQARSSWAAPLATWVMRCAVP